MDYGDGVFMQGEGSALLRRVSLALSIFWGMGSRCSLADPGTSARFSRMIRDQVNGLRVNRN